MKVRPTWTDAAGNGYYRGSDGKYYYGNAKNGYLRETIQERNARLARERNVQIQKQKQAEVRQAGNVSPVNDFSFRNAVERVVCISSTNWACPNAESPK